MVLTVLKCHFVRLQPTTIHYRDYKYFDPEAFINDVKDANLDAIVSLSDPNSVYSDFCAHFKSILDLHAFLKSKTLRENQAPFMSKDLSKAIMTRSRLKKTNLIAKKLKQTGKLTHFKEISVFSYVKRP